MVVYNLDETPDVFISPDYYDNKFVFEMARIDNNLDETIRSIDLRNDKLLHESLLLRPQRGYVYVNCNGETYVLKSGKFYRPIHNVIFDWSSFGVIVPNSLNASLKKQVEELEKAVEKSNKEGEIAKASLIALNDEVNELKKVQNELGLEMQKAYEKVALIDFEVELYKIELKSCKRELDEVLDDLCSCKDERAKMEVEMRMLRDQLSSEISTANKRNYDLDMQSKIWKMRNYDLEMKSKSLENKLSSVLSELQSTKDQLESSNNKVNELEEQLLSFKNKCEDMKDKLEKVEELKDQIRFYEEEHQCMELLIQKMNNHIELINMEVKSSNQKLDQLLISSLWKKFNHTHHNSQSFITS
ncbi:hypothetical protein RND81_09G096900 [Saponaria officinalis]|uniref:Uncharacterized protein n=1 Tax=Saponaria officinalis TaxID=3572 RepID=A0AAW1IJY9_SAPOF